MFSAWNLGLLLGVVHISGVLCESEPITPDIHCDPYYGHFEPKNPGDVCRVIKGCPKGDNSCSPEAESVRCVPAASDKKCMKKGLRAILVGHPSSPHDLKPMRCNRRKKCPDWAKCFKRHCCYFDALEQEHPPPHPVCCPAPCKSGMSCLKVKATCGDTYACYPIKEGICPTAILPPDQDCTTIKVGRFCENDWDCTGENKCCPTVCGGSDCKKPQIFKG